MTGDAHCGGKRSDEPAEVVMFCGGKRSDEPAEVVMFCGGKRSDEPAEVVMFYTGTEDSAITRQSVFYPKIKKKLTAVHTRADNMIVNDRINFFMFVYFSLFTFCFLLFASLSAMLLFCIYH